MRDFIGEIAHILNAVHTALVKRQSLYAHVVGAVLEIGRQEIAAAAGGPDARAFDQALIDRIAQVRRDFAAEIAHAGETGHQRPARVADRAEREIDLIEPELFLVGARTRLVAEMHVQIGPTRGAGVSGEVDGVRTRDLDAPGADFGDLAVAYDHGMRAQHLRLAAVEDAFALERDLCGGDVQRCEAENREGGGEWGAMHGGNPRERLADHNGPRRGVARPRWRPGCLRC